MTKNIFDIIGDTIRKIKCVEDYHQIFINRGIINIYNPFKLYKNNVIVDENLIYKVSNVKIADVQYVEEQFLKIILENEYGIKISLLNEDYCTPEAINIYFASGEIIVL